MDEFDRLEEKIDAARGTPANSNKKESVKDENGRQGIHAGIEFVASIFIPALIGWQLDKWLGTSPAFFLILLFLGICGGFYSVYKISQGLGSSVGISRLQDKKKDAKTSNNKN